jgi:sugar (pentulose or hexulose) kinase
MSEICRFPNEPVQYCGELHWDILRLWHEMKKALESPSIPKLESIGIDTWGVDYALLGERGNLIENPYHYRDERTEGIMDAVFALTPRENIYAITGIQSLAFKYRSVLESLEELTGIRFEEIRIMGGGSKNRLLNQFTADATGRTVVAGPSEATALGNIAMQMLATGAVTSLAEARKVIDRSFPVERFEPSAADRWDSQYRRFQNYLESADG